MNKMTRADAVPAVLLLLFCLGLFAPLLYGDQTFFFRDITFFNYPTKFFIFRALHEGRLPFWEPSLFSGTPFMSLLFPAALYPPGLIFLMDDFYAAFNLFYFGHYLFLIFSVYVLVRSWGIGPWPALFAALTTLFGGYFLSLGAVFTHFQSSVWLPSALYFSGNFLRTRSVSDFFGALVCLVCQNLAASAETIIMTAFLLFPYAAFYARQEAGEIRRRTLWVAAILALSIGLSAPQFLPTWKLLGESVRDGGLDYAAHTEWSLRPETILTLIWPMDLKNIVEKLDVGTFFPGIYMGVFAIMGFCIALFFCNNREVRFWLVVFFTGLFLALGRYNPLYAFFYEWFPLLRLFRYPEKFLFFSAFALVFLSGYGGEILMTTDFGKRFRLSLLATVSLLLVVGVLAIINQIPDIDPQASLACLLVIGGGVVLRHFGRLSPQWLGFFIVAVIAIDLLPKNLWLIPTVPVSLFETPPRLISRLQNEKALFRVFSGPPFLAGNETENAAPFVFTGRVTHEGAKQMLYPNQGSIYGIQYPDGKTGVELKDQQLWRMLLAKAPPQKKMRILQRSNVKYRVRREAFVTGTDDFTIPEEPLELVDGFLPRAFLAGDARTQDFAHTVNLYFDAAFDPLSTVLLNVPVEWKRREDFAGRAEVETYEPERVVLKTQQNGEGFLVLLDSWFPGWTARVDGKDAPVLRANHFFRAVQLGAGEHRVEFIYEPVGFRDGLLICSATLLAVLVGSAFVGFRTRSQTSHVDGR